MRQKWPVRTKTVVLKIAEALKSDVKSYRDLDIPKSTFYDWKRAFKKEGVAGLIPKKPIPKSHPKQLSSESIEKILHLRSKYHFGPQRIVWYLERYHGITVSGSSVYRTLARHGMKRLPENVGRRAIHTRRYSKQVPWHYVQVDVKFLTLKQRNVKKYAGISILPLMMLLV